MATRWPDEGRRRRIARRTLVLVLAWVLVLATVGQGLTADTHVALAQATDLNPNPGGGGSGGGPLPPTDPTPGGGGSGGGPLPTPVPTIFVTSLADDGPGSLRDAIRTAPAGATVAFAIQSAHCIVRPCIIELTGGELAIDKNLAIHGPGPRHLTIRISPASTTPRTFRIARFRQVTISGVALELWGRSVSGAGFLNEGSLTLTDTSIGKAEVGADAFGGAIHNAEGAVLRATNVEIDKSTARAGGGIYNAGGAVTLTSVTIHDSIVTGGSGAAFYNANGGTAVLTNSTIYANEARANGTVGGVYNDGSSTLTLVNTTVSGNTAPAGANNIANASGTVTLRNSIVMGQAARPNCSGVILASGRNLSSDASCGVPSGDPLLGELGDQGGLTPTIPLVPGSPAIDGGDPDGCTDAAGRPLETDQRGAPRPPGGGCDLGAYELVALAGSGPPVFSATPALTLLEDSSAVKVYIDVADSDAPSNQTHITSSASSDNQALLPNDAIVLETPGDRAGTRVVSFRPAANVSGTATISLTATDEYGHQIRSAHLTVTVLPVNDPPSFTAGRDVSANGGVKFSQTWATNVSAGAPAESDQHLTFALTVSDPSLFSAQPEIDALGTLGFIPTAQASGVVSVAVALKDDGGTAFGGSDSSATQQFKIELTPANRAPQAVDDGYLLTGATLNVAAPGVLGNDTDPDGEAISATKLTNPAHGSLTLNADGSFGYTPTLGYSGPDSFTYTATDKAAKSNVATVALTVIAPTSPATPAVSIADVSVAEGDSGSRAATLSVTLSAASGQPVTVQYSTGNGTATAGADYQATNGTLTIGPGQFSASIQVQVLGDTVQEPDESFTVTLAAPTGATLGRATATVTLANDDAATGPGTVPNPPVPPQRCAPRPNPSLQIESIGVGRQRVTVTAQTNALLPSNALERIVIAPARNARVEVAGATPDANGNVSLSLPAGTQTSTFIVQRLAAGDFRADVQIYDGCQASGEFRTFVGGGTGVR